MNFDRAFALIVGSEGVYNNDRNDPGNWTGGKVGVGELKGTKYGISAASYPDLNIVNLTLAQAKEIYQRDFWDKIHGEEVPWGWGLCLFDCAVNQGPGTAVRLAQDAVGALVDGKMGPRTILALKTADDRKLARFLAKRALRYTINAQFQADGFGWFTRLFVRAFDAEKVA